MNKTTSFFICAFLLILCEQTMNAETDCGDFYANRRYNDYQILIQWPWQANIYRKSCSSCNATYVCGGTIVNENVIVSVRGCFVNLQTGKEWAKSEFVVAVGKFNRDFDHSFDAETQQNFNVKTINYRANSTLYEDNIVTITLNSSIVFENGVKPICLNDHRQIEESGRNRGIVGYFGAPENSDEIFSDVLNLASLDIVSKDKCKRQMPESVHKYFNSEQLCLEYEVEYRYVRHSVMGEGVAIRVETNNENKYYLRGVISGKYQQLDEEHKLEYMIVSDAVPVEEFIKSNFL